MKRKVLGILLMLPGISAALGILIFGLICDPLAVAFVVGVTAGLLMLITLFAAGVTKLRGER